MYEYAELELRNQVLSKTNVQLAQANANAAELISEIEQKNARIERLNDALAAANVQSAELVVALEESREQIRVAAMRDVLTGLYNRRHFEEQLHACVNAAKRHELPLSLCVCDLDHFKSINDRFGHRVGDRVLSRFGEIVTKILRAEDIATRYGGDEFCFLLPCTTAADARHPIERIRETLHTEFFGTEDGFARISGTFGIAQLGPGGCGSALFEAADRALYRAKERGRDCVEVIA